MRPYILLSALLLISSVASAQDQQDFCTATIETAKSQSIILRSPQAVVGVTQSPLAGAAAQSVAGVEESIQGLRKAHAVLLAARATCKQYKATEDATVAAQYILPVMEANALRYRLSLDYRALNELEGLEFHAEKLLDSQNTTRPSVYSIQSAINKVQTDITSTLASLSVIQIPDQYKSLPLDQLLEAEQSAVAENQNAAVKVLHTQNWDLQLTGGVRHTLLPLGNSQAGGYGGFNFTYSFGSRSSDRHLAQAAAATQRWDNETITGSAYLIKVAKEQIIKTLITQTDRLTSLQSQKSVIDANLKAIDGIDTTAVNTFRTTLETDKVLLRVEVSDAEFRISELK